MLEITSTCSPISTARKREREKEKEMKKTKASILAALLHFLIFSHLLKISPQVLPTSHVDEYPESTLNHLDQPINIQDFRIT